MAMADTSQVPVPMHDALQACKKEAETASSLLDFLLENGYLSVELDYSDFGRIVGEFLEIDAKQLEAEKEALLETINLPEGEFAVPEHCTEVRQELPDTERRMYRVRAVIVSTTLRGDTEFTLPGYGPDLFSIPTCRIPFLVKPGDMVHATANKGAENPADVSVTFLSASDEEATKN